MQDFELWWLLVFPVFFGLGWLAARIDMREVLRAAEVVPSSYFRGLSALVADNTEHAVQALAMVAKNQPRERELQLALGQLYRRRGENDLAIRLHQTLLEAPEQTPAQLDEVRYELAEDYLRAGLVDRAEVLLVPLSKGAVAQQAQRRLLDIYQQERNWPRAIELSQTLHGSNVEQGHELAQYYCELAQSALYHSKTDEARHALTQAFNANRRCTRANLLLGDLELSANNIEAALVAWMAIEAQNPDYLTLVAERVLDGYEHLERAAEGVKLVRGWLLTYPQLNVLDLLYARVSSLEGDEAGLACLREAVHRQPTLLGLGKLIDAQFLQFTPDGRQDAELARELITGYGKRLNVHRCKRCAFRSKTFFWHCPACGEWESFTPNASEAS